MAEGLGVGVAELHHADAVAHAVVGDHRAGRLRGLLDVVGGAGRGVAEDDLFGDAPAHAVDQVVEELVAGLVEAVLGGHDHRVAQGAAARQDRHLRDRVRVVQGGGGQGVAGLVVGGHGLVVVVHDAGTLLRARDHTVDGLVDGALVDELHVRTRGEQRRLVEDVRQVRTREAGRALGNLTQVNLLGERLALRVHLQDGLAALQVGSLDGDLTVETPRAQQRRVEDVGTVGRRDQDNVGALVEAVHLDEELVQGLLALVVAATDAGAAVATHGVNLVDEDDGRRVLLGALEKLTHAGRAHADVELHELRARNREEGSIRLAGHGLGEEGLTGSGRTVEQDAARNTRTHLVELIRGGQELADLLELLHGLVLTGDVREGDVGALLVEFLGARLGETAHHARARHGAHDEVERAHEDQQRNQQLEESAEGARLGTDRVPPLGRGLGGHGVQDVLRLHVRVREIDALAQIRGLVVIAGALVHVAFRERQVHLLGALVEDHLLHRITRDERQALRGRDRARLVRLPQEPATHQQDDERNQHPAQAGALILNLLVHRRPLQVSVLSCCTRAAAACQRRAGCGTFQRNPGRNRRRTHREYRSPHRPHRRQPWQPPACAGQSRS